MQYKPKPWLTESEKAKSKKATAIMKQYSAEGQTLDVYDSLMVLSDETLDMMMSDMGITVPDQIDQLDLLRPEECNHKWSKWKTESSGQPYNDGHAIFRECRICGEKHVTDIGVPKEEAKQIVDNENQTRNR